MTDKPDLMRGLAEAALHCAMRDIQPMTSRERHQAMERIAAGHPDLIEEEIGRLQRKINLMREYVPVKEASRDGE